MKLMASSKSIWDVKIDFYSSVKQFQNLPHVLPFFLVSGVVAMYEAKRLELDWRSATRKEYDYILRHSLKTFVFPKIIFFRLWYDTIWYQIEQSMYNGLEIIVRSL